MQLEAGGDDGTRRAGAGGTVQGEDGRVVSDTGRCGWRATVSDGAVVGGRGDRTGGDDCVDAAEAGAANVGRAAAPCKRVDGHRVLEDPHLHEKYAQPAQGALGHGNCWCSRHPLPQRTRSRLRQLLPYAVASGLGLGLCGPHRPLFQGGRVFRSSGGTRSHPVNAAPRRRPLSSYPAPGAGERGCGRIRRTVRLFCAAQVSAA
mmetsp:Transcript_11006/g.33748  ORF Transcript_11006/g.33748 Transcript_11006/m.33748 type:complete len:204 (+) Transcript_11006:112-723(+)